MNGEPAGRLRRPRVYVPQHQGKKSFCWLLPRAAPRSLCLLIVFVFDPEFELEMCGGGSLCTCC
jgi:hypothetical protein